MSALWGPTILGVPRLPQVRGQPGTSLQTLGPPLPSGSQMAAVSGGRGAVLDDPVGSFLTPGCWAQWSPVHLPAHRGTGHPSCRCCRAVAWSPLPSPRDGQRRTPSPQASNSQSRSAPRRRRSRRRCQASPATGAARIELGRVRSQGASAAAAASVRGNLRTVPSASPPFAF